MANHFVAMFAPAWERGLKRPVRGSSVGFRTFAPAWERGLKLGLRDFFFPCGRVRSRVGAWIETLYGLVQLHDRKFAPAWERGLKPCVRGGLP